MTEKNPPSFLIQIKKSYTTDKLGIALYSLD